MPGDPGGIVTRSKRWGIAVLIPLALAALSWQWWLPLPAGFLVRGDPPVKSDGIVVLAGDGYGYRIRAAADLAQRGYAPIVLASGAAWIYGVCECDLAIDYAVRQGYPRALFEPLRNDATSTEAEALAIFREARRRGWSSILIVTSDYHTRRARLILNRLKPEDLRVTVYAAPDRFFRADRWWSNRESRKTLVLEWSKLGAALLGGL